MFVLFLLLFIMSSLVILLIETLIYAGVVKIHDLKP